MKRLIFVLQFIFISIEGVKLPDTFQKCNRKDPDWKECALKAAQNAIPQLTKPFDEVNTPSINPFKFPAATIGAGSGTVAVEQNFKNCDVYGFHELKLDVFEFDFEKKTLKGAGTFPEVRLLCEYDLDGKVLLLAIKGHGPSTIILKNLEANAVFNYEEVMKKGKTYIRFISSTVDINPEFMSFNFENLFNGDKQLGDNINQVLNDNWKEVFIDVKKGYVELVNQILVGLLNNFFSKVSMEEAFD